jgi:hypothetical protein
MHVILLKNGTIYIMTASALKSEFSLYYQDFFKSMRSLRIVTDMIDIISNKEQKAELKNEIQKICDHWKLLLAEKQKIDPQANLEELQKEVFNSESFQSTTWGPFKEMLNKKFTDLGSDWQSTIEKQVQEELFALPDTTKQNLSNNPKDESKESLYV